MDNVESITQNELRVPVHVSAAFAEVLRIGLRHHVHDGNRSGHLSAGDNGYPISSAAREMATKEEPVTIEARRGEAMGRTHGWVDYDYRSGQPCDVVAGKWMGLGSLW